MQRSLFDPEPPAQRHSPTSVDAARQVAPRTGTLRAAVLAALKAAPGGLTDEELQESLSMGASTQRPRRIELVAAGLVRDGGTTRRTRSGRLAVVWVAVV